MVTHRDIIEYAVRPVTLNEIADHFNLLRDRTNNKLVKLIRANKIKRINIWGHSYMYRTKRLYVAMTTYNTIVKEIEESNDSDDFLVEDYYNLLLLKLNTLRDEQIDIQ